MTAIQALSAGWKTNSVLEVGELRDGTLVTVPVRTVKGAKPGKTLVLTGMQHGDEVNGCGVINKVIDELDPAELSGTVIGFPVSSPLALISNSRVSVLDYEGLNSNRIYPGDAAGLAVERAAWAVYENGVQQADYLIDFHDGGYDFMARYIMLQGDPEFPEVSQQNLEMAKLVGQGIPVLDQLTGAVQLQQGFGGSITAVTARCQVPSVAVELGGAGKLWDWAVNEGAQGAVNVMRGFGLLDGDPVGAAGRPGSPEQLVGFESEWPRPAHGGWWEQVVSLGDVVERGQKVGHVRNALFEIIEELYAPYDCVIYDIRNSSAIMTGEWTVHCGRLRR